MKLADQRFFSYYTYQIDNLNRDVVLIEEHKINRDNGLLEKSFYRKDYSSDLFYRIEYQKYYDYNLIERILYAGNKELSAIPLYYVKENLNKPMVFLTYRRQSIIQDLYNPDYLRFSFQIIPDHKNININYELAEYYFKNAFTENAGINNSMLLKAREFVDKALLE